MPALDDALADAARRRLFDTMACFVAGASADEGQLMLRLLQASSGRSPAAADLVRYACAATRHTEIDDIHIQSCTTVGSMVVPTALIAAAFQPDGEVDEADVLRAIVAGYEAMASLGMAVDGAIRIYQGTWSTYLTAPFAAAAAVARLTKLAAGQTANALAIAASRCVGTTGRMGGPTTSRWFTTGCAAADGFLAGRSAALGMIGDPGVLEQPFQQGTGIEVKPEPLAGNQDGRWRILDIDTKPYRTGRQALSATDAFIRVIDSHPDDIIDAIAVGVPGQVKAMVDRPELPANSMPGGVQYQLALALNDRLGLFDVGHRRQHDTQNLTPLMSKVKVSEEAKLTSLYPNQWGGHVEVRWANGTKAEAEVLDPRGSSRAPYDWKQLLDKHQQVAEAISGLDAWLEPLQHVCRDFGRPGKNRSRELLRLLPGMELLAS